MATTTKTKETKKFKEFLHYVFVFAPIHTYVPIFTFVFVGVAFTLFILNGVPLK